MPNITRRGSHVDDYYRVTLLWRPPWQDGSIRAWVVKLKFLLGNGDSSVDIWAGKSLHTLDARAH